MLSVAYKEALYDECREAKFITEEYLQKPIQLQFVKVKRNKRN